MTVISDDKLQKMSYDELRKEREIAQGVRRDSKIYLHKITILINGILQENEALRTLTPETAKALGMPDEKIKLLKELQAKRKKAIKEGKGDVIIQHVKTLTIGPKAGNHTTKGGN
jgi:ApbE superfamily uncharacterized protein (UPF0280 family)